MNITLQKSEISNQRLKIRITGSKSETNRLLLLQALYPELEIENVSNSDDSNLMSKALSSQDKVIDIHHAGTAMRFLTAFFSTQEGREIELTGSQRMKERPIGILVHALNQLGAEINYKEKEGFPPLLIKGKELSNHQVSLKANVSSQYISALLLIGSKLKNGLELTLEGKIISVPYINMTLDLLDRIGVKSSFTNNVITIKSQSSNIEQQRLVVESDWSSASYYFSIVALSPLKTEIELSAYKKDSLQGDSCLAKIYEAFGVKTKFLENSILLKKIEKVNRDSKIELDLSNAPDIAQTITVTAFALGIACYLKGLETLKIKETDRLEALKAEIEKLGGNIKTTNSTLALSKNNAIKKNIAISTYNDHRMAMAFAPLALKVSVIIEDGMVVTKSYPTFWSDLKSLGFKISE